MAKRLIVPYFSSTQNIALVDVKDQDEVLDKSKKPMASITAAELKAMGRFKVILLESNKLYSVPPDLLWDQQLLVNLSLKDNKLSHLPDKLFKDLPNLTEIDLSCNKLKELPETLFRGLSNLKTLNLRSNRLFYDTEESKTQRNIPETIFAGLASLRTLDLSRNRFVTLPRDLFLRAPKIHILNLEHNEIKKLPPEVLRENRSLRVLILSFNHLQTLPVDLFWNCRRLLHIYLDHNELESLPFGLFDRQSYGFGGLVDVAFNCFPDGYIVPVPPRYQLKGSHQSTECGLSYLKQNVNSCYAKTMHIIGLLLYYAELFMTGVLMMTLFQSGDYLYMSLLGAFQILAIVFGIYEDSQYLRSGRSPILGFIVDCVSRVLFLRSFVSLIRSWKKYETWDLVHLKYANLMTATTLQLFLQAYILLKMVINGSDLLSMESKILICSIGASLLSASFTVSKLFTPFTQEIIRYYLLDLGSLPSFNSCGYVWSCLMKDMLRYIIIFNDLALRVATIGLWAVFVGVYAPVVYGIDLLVRLCIRQIVTPKWSHRRFILFPSGVIGSTLVDAIWADHSTSHIFASFFSILESASVLVTGSRYCQFFPVCDLTTIFTLLRLVTLALLAVKVLELILWRFTSLFKPFRKENINGFARHQKTDGTILEGDFINGILEGKGRVTRFSDVFLKDWEYEGEVKNDLRHGKGKCVYHPTADVHSYDGEWVHDKYQGSGKMQYKNGDIYVGDWHQNKRHGKGLFAAQDGGKYEGEWLDDMRSGFGVYLFSKGQYDKRYEGEWQDGTPHGKGIVEFSKGGSYDGEWCDGHWQGSGKLTDSQGNSYVGEFFQSKKHGYGKMKFATGAEYEGDWENDCFHGKGSLKFVGSGNYEGDFKNGLKDGYGRLLFSNGNLYEGQWAKDSMHGHGKLVYPTGLIYEGEFVSGAKHGKGTSYYLDGLGEVGNWINGERDGAHNCYRGNDRAQVLFHKGAVISNKVIEAMSVQDDQLWKAGDKVQLSYVSLGKSFVFVKSEFGDLFRHAEIFHIS